MHKRGIFLVFAALGATCAALGAWWALSSAPQSERAAANPEAKAPAVSALSESFGGRLPATVSTALALRSFNAAASMLQAEDLPPHHPATALVDQVEDMLGLEVAHPRQLEAQGYHVSAPVVSGITEAGVAMVVFGVTDFERARTQTLSGLAELGASAKPLVLADHRGHGFLNGAGKTHEAALDYGGELVWASSTGIAVEALETTLREARQSQAAWRERLARLAQWELPDAAVAIFSEAIGPPWPPEETLGHSPMARALEAVASSAVAGSGAEMEPGPTLTTVARVGNRWLLRSAEMRAGSPASAGALREHACGHASFHAQAAEFGALRAAAFLETAQWAAALALTLALDAEASGAGPRLRPAIRARLERAMSPASPLAALRGLCVRAALSSWGAPIEGGVAIRAAAPQETLPLEWLDAQDGSQGHAQDMPLDAEQIRCGARGAWWGCGTEAFFAALGRADVGAPPEPSTEFVMSLDVSAMALAHPELLSALPEPWGRGAKWLAAQLEAVTISGKLPGDVWVLDIEAVAKAK